MCKDKFIQSKLLISEAQNLHACLDIQLRVTVKISDFSLHKTYFSLINAILLNKNHLGKLGSTKNSQTFSIVIRNQIKGTLKVSTHET